MCYLGTKINNINFFHHHVISPWFKVQGSFIQRPRLALITTGPTQATVLVDLGRRGGDTCVELA